MKKVIELLEMAHTKVSKICANEPSFRIKEKLAEISGLIKVARVELSHKLQWETPEQWEKRTGKAWQDYWAVYYRTRHNLVINGTETWTMWAVSKYKTVKKKTAAQIVCTTEAGHPPYDWDPGEDNP
jgi:hypothetical protein